MLQDDSHQYIFKAISEDASFDCLTLEEKIAVFNFFVQNEIGQTEFTKDFQNALFALDITTVDELKTIIFDALWRLDIDA